MSLLVSELRDAGRGVLSRLQSAVATLRRTTAAVLLLRLLVFGALGCAWAVVLPPTLPFWALALPVALATALAAALFPRTRAVGFVLVTIVVTWIVTTYLDGAASLQRLLGLAAALYVAHAAAAFAAVLPSDTAVAASAILRWGLRTSMVLAVSLGVGVGGLAVASRLPPAHSLVGPIVGTLVAGGIVGLIVWLTRRG